MKFRMLKMSTIVDIAYLVLLLAMLSCVFVNFPYGVSDHLFVFVALRPMSTAMVIAGRSVHLTTLFPGQA